MSTASLLALGEGAGALASFSKSHQQSHNKVGRATNTRLIIVDPMNLADEQARKVFLLDHYLAHQSINEFFKTTGPDLSELDFNDPKEVRAWIDLNYLDHNAWEKSLAGQ